MANSGTTAWICTGSPAWRMHDQQSMDGKTITTMSGLTVHWARNRRRYSPERLPDMLNFPRATMLGLWGTVSPTAPGECAAGSTNSSESVDIQMRPGSSRTRRWDWTTLPLLRVTSLPGRPKGEVSMPLLLWQTLVACPLFFHHSQGEWGSRFSDRCLDGTKLTHM